jgi:hypothetical protein
LPARSKNTQAQEQGQHHGDGGAKRQGLERMLRAIHTLRDQLECRDYQGRCERIDAISGMGRG